MTDIQGYSVSLCFDLFSAYAENVEDFYLINERRVDFDFVVGGIRIDHDFFFRLSISRRIY